MFDIGFSELVLIAVVALVAIGPEDLPEMLFKLGRAVRQGKMFIGNIRNQYAEIMHEAEVAHYRKQLNLPPVPETKLEQADIPLRSEEKPE